MSHGYLAAAFGLLACLAARLRQNMGELHSGGHAMTRKQVFTRRGSSVGHVVRTVVAMAIMGLTAVVRAQTPPCSSDLDGDGVVTGGDLSAVLLAWGPCQVGEGCAADLDGDGVVTGGDLSVILVNWGPCAGPAWATVLEWAPDPAVIYDSNLRADIASTNLPWRVRDNGTGIEMVLIPPGTYTRGCSASNSYGCNSDESPTHQVTLTQAFYLSRTEVTQAQWVATMGNNPSNFQSASSAVPASEVPNRPVEQVSWNDIQPFCTATGMRLPTEAEWEYAYRAGTTTAFHGWPANPNGTNDDNQLGTIAWFYDGSCSTGAQCQTRPVGGKAANGFGLFDMSGNVWEWCQDWYGTYASGAQTNPTGPGSGIYRVLRGGFWRGLSYNCRASLRNNLTPVPRVNAVGFRVARTP
jgi:formylglycine-generating enzyme required for sulfatase activity